MRFWRSGATVLQEEHQEAFQKVRSGVREEAERRSRVSRSVGEQTLDGNVSVWLGEWCRGGNGGMRVRTYEV